MKTPKFTIKKVPLKGFIALLNDLYMDGAEFADFHGHIDHEEHQDNITVSVPMEYMNEEYMSEQPLPPPGVEEDGIITEEPLTDGDVEKLINNA